MSALHSSDCNIISFLCRSPPDMQPAVASLRALFDACAAAAAGAPGKRREMDDNSRRLGALFWRLNADDVSDSVRAKLAALGAALAAGDFASASQMQVRLLFACTACSLYPLAERDMPRGQAN